MATPIEKIAEEAAAMTREDRLALVRVLLHFDKPSNDEEATAAWDREIRARIKATDEGRISGIPYEQIKQEMAHRFGAR